MGYKDKAVELLEANVESVQGVNNIANETLMVPVSKERKDSVTRGSVTKVSKEIEGDGNRILSELVDLDNLKFLEMTVDDAQEVEVLDFSSYPTFKSFEVLKYFTNLKSLNVSGLDFFSADYSYITSTVLEKLDVSNTKVDDAIIDRLVEQRALRMVRLTGLKLGDERVYDLRRNMPSTSIFFWEQDEDE